MKLQIIHETRYDYLPAVETAQHMAYLQPLNTAQQLLISHTLIVSPTPAQMSQTQDVFGNARRFFSLQTPHSNLSVVAHSENTYAILDTHAPPRHPRRRTIS